MTNPPQSKLKVSEPGRLDAFLANNLPAYSRSTLQKLCKQGSVRVNSINQEKPGYLLKPTDVVEVFLPDFQPKPLHLEILYEDADVIVINKPAGVLTHAKGALNDEYTVAEFMRGRTTDAPESNRPGIVHRLDRATSGVIITAKNPNAKHWLQKQFSTRNVKKTYLALVNGTPKQPAAVIDLPIERNPKRPQIFRVSSNGKPALTAYETLQSFKRYTLLKLMPQTGRTHQLRVHMAYLGCPIVGDELYGTAEPKLGRMFLHAADLELTLPSRERKTFTAPLPEDLQNFLKIL